MPGLAQEARGEEVDERLPPAGALDDEHARVVVDQSLDRLELPVAEVGAVAENLLEQLVGAGRGVHRAETAGSRLAT